MRILGPYTVLLGALLVCGCSAEDREEDYEAGPNGEPPKALESMRVYAKQFTADQSNYVLALGKIHAFLVADGYEPIAYTSCFGEVPNAIGEGREKQFPCVALHAQKGVPTKAHLVVTVDEVRFNQLDHNNRLAYTVSIFGREPFYRLPTPALESGLSGLYTGGSSNDRPVAP
jgi:hypothetical protein